MIARLRQAYPDIWLSVSVTTRQPRPGEKNGREYKFVSDREFDRLISAGELLEWARYSGHRYGTPRSPVEEKLTAGIPALLEIDVQGARQVRARMAGALLVFLAPPSWAELERRLNERGTEPPDAVRRRLATARAELAAEHEFDVTLINTSVDEVCERLVVLMRAPLDERIPGAGSGRRL